MYRGGAKVQLAGAFLASIILTHRGGRERERGAEGAAPQMMRTRPKQLTLFPLAIFHAVLL